MREITIDRSRLARLEEIARQRRAVSATTQERRSSAMLKRAHAQSDLQAAQNHVAAFGGWNEAALGTRKEAVTRAAAELARLEADFKDADAEAARAAELARAAGVLYENAKKFVADLDAETARRNLAARPAEPYKRPAMFEHNYIPLGGSRPARDADDIEAEIEEATRATRGEHLRAAVDKLSGGGQ